MPRGTAVVVPAGTDLNRGDQALIWEAVSLLRASASVDEVAIVGEAAGGAGSGLQTDQSQAAGYRTMPGLLDSPRRGRSRERDKLADGAASLARLALTSLADFARSAAILLLARHPRWVRPLLSARQRPTYETIRAATVLVVKGGGFLHAYGGPRAPYYIWFQLFYLRLAHRLGIPVVVLPNSFGPFVGWTVAGQIRRVLSRCAFVSARESVSARALEDVLRRPVPVLPDMGYFLEPAPPEVGETACRGAGVPLGDVPCVGFTVRPWRFPGTRDPAARFDRYIGAVAALVRHVALRGCHPVLISHVLGPGAHEDDRLALDDLARRLGPVRFSRVDHPGTCRDLKSIYACMDYVVGTRFHSVIFAQGAGVPCLAIGYGGNKAVGIMNDRGLGEYVVPIEEATADVLCRRFDLLVRNEATVRESNGRWRTEAPRQRERLRGLIASRLEARPAAL